MLHAYRQWGLECLPKLNGIFAFALWDERERQLVLARDRFGVKPLYLHESRQKLVFASEIRAVIAGVRIAPEVNEGPLYGFLLNGRLDHTTETFFVGVRKLPAGSYMVVSEQGKSVRLYWELPRRANDAPFEENVARFRELFFDAVRLQMRSDVPIGA